jgi:hypothetical protein
LKKLNAEVAEHAEKILPGESIDNDFPTHFHRTYISPLQRGQGDLNPTPQSHRNRMMFRVVNVESEQFGSG